MTIQIDEQTVEVDGVRYKREEQGWMPKAGQLIQVRNFKDSYWRCDVLRICPPLPDTEYPWVCEYDEWGYARPLTDDKQLIGRTFAPEGARWFAPWVEDEWGWFYNRPEIGIGGFYTNIGLVGKMYLPTNGEEPIKLWEDEDE